MCEPYKPQSWILKGCYIFSVANSELIKKNIAIVNNDVELIKQVIKNGIKPSYDTILAAAQLGNLKIVQDGKLYENYSEEMASKYMKNENIEISVEVYTGKKGFTAYTLLSVHVLVSRRCYQH